MKKYIKPQKHFNIIICNKMDEQFIVQYNTKNTTRADQSLTAITAQTDQ